MADGVSGAEIQPESINTRAFGLNDKCASQQAAMTTQLNTIVPADPEGTPDYNIQAITNTAPFGFVIAQEAITVLYVIKNLQTRVAELEAKIKAFGLIA